MAKAYESTPIQRIVANQLLKGDKVFTEPGEINIVYIEGCNIDFSPNANRFNAFDCLRCAYTFEDGTPKVLGTWDATTHPGLYWTMHPMNDNGAFIIRLGQQSCWRAGEYHNMPALVQTEEIEGYRDAKKDFKREGDIFYRGLFGVHHHGGYDYPHDDLGRSSAGCQVGRTMEGHREFMAIVKTDPRYLADNNFIFSSTVMTYPEAFLSG